MSSKDIFKDLGIDVKSNNDVVKELNKDSVNKKDRGIPDKPTMIVRGGHKEMAVRLGIIPKSRVDVEYDVKKIEENIMEQSRVSPRKFKVKGFNEYVQTLNSIISSIRVGLKPKCSYIIGAPNGFGKTSFVTSCLKLMVAKELKAVPYISLLELAEIRVENERSLLRGIELKARKRDEEDEGEYVYSSYRDFVKVPEVITGCYSWSEYMNSDILFCFFSSIDSKVIESNTLKGILEIRGAKGLPTIVFISTSLDPYKNDKNLREFVWDEILTTKEEDGVYDRVYHVSTYKVYSNLSDNMSTTPPYRGWSL